MKVKPCVRFDGLIIKNGRTFKDLSVSLEGQGVVSVIGQNGSGKSSIFNIMQAIIYASTSTGHKRDNLVTFDDDAYFALDFRVREKPFRIEYGRMSGKWRHKVYVDGRAIGHHSAVEETKEAAKSIGLTKKEFEGSVHLTQHASHVLISGLPSERKKYIAEFFELDERWDRVWEAAKRELDKTRERVALLSGYSHTIEALQHQLTAIPQHDLSEIEAELYQASRALEEASARGRRLWEASRAYEIYLPHAEYFSLYEDPEGDLERLNQAYGKVSHALAEADAIRKRNRETLVVKERRESARSSLSAILQTHPDIEMYNQSEHSSLMNKWNHYASQERYRAEYAALGDPVKMPTDKLGAEAFDTTVLLAEKERHRQTQLSGKCHQCGSVFHGEAEVTEVEIASIRKSLAEINGRLEKIRAENDRYDKKQKLASFVTAQALTPLEMDRLRSLSEQSKVYSDYLNLASFLASPEPVVEDVPDTDSLKARASAIEAEIKRLFDLVSVRKQIGVVPPEPVDSALLSEARLAQSTAQSVVSAVSSRLAVAKSNASTRARLEADIKKLQDELSGLDRLKAQELYWKAMADAYGPKGLRVDDLNRVMDVIIKRLPFNTAKLFDDPTMTFRHITDAGNIEVLVSRLKAHPDTGEMVRYEHDISSLSGGEARRLSVALVVTMAECVVNTKRTNLLILDEVDSNLDAIGKHKYINDFLPSLKGRWDTVFVISHDEEIQQAAIYDKVWRLEKKDGWTTVSQTDCSQNFGHANALSQQ